MTELGLLAGDPCAADGWTPEQQARGYGWWLARMEGAPGLTVGPSDLRRVWREIVAAFAGLRGFLATGIVILGRRK